MSNAGELAQIVNGDPFRFMAYIEFRPYGETLRGNHFHEQKTEFLYVISGRLTAHYIDLENDETLTIDLTGGDLVTIEPRCAHAYRALEHTHAIEFTKTVYNPTDTFPYKVYSGGEPGR